MRVKKLPTQKHYTNKILRNAFVGLLVILVSLLIGVFGYHYFFDLNWIDSLYNASMILTGMGPVDKATSDGGKIFASVYAIYSGVTFLTSVAIVLSPVVHRFLHQFRLDIEE